MKPAHLLGLLLLDLTLVCAGDVCAQAPAPPRQGIIFVADGAGDYTTVAEGVYRLIVCERGLPYTVRSVRWCRWSLPARDHADVESRLIAARRLAHDVKAYRAAHPQERICLIGHSDGTHVIVLAAELLPPGSVDRIVLTGSTVSYTYDLRPALRCVRGGIDALFSKEDHVVVLSADTCGTSDGKHTQGAGEVGFAMPPPTHPDAPLYQRLRQYAWNSSWAGHNGTHAGYLRLAFLDTYIVPLLLSSGIR